MLRIGVLGAGHLGKIHIQCIQQIPGYQMAGFFDPDEKNSSLTIEKFGIKRFDDLDELIDSVDVVDIVTSTLSHYECAEKALKKFRHLFIEKPMTNSLENARRLISLVEEANVKAMVGHVERFNPAFTCLKDYSLKPVFIEAHRLAPFNPRGTDVSVILDLMIHDIDIVLKLVKSTVRRISANGVSVISESPDIANARIEFDNGCVANLTASRISLKVMRKMRLFQRDAYISMDFSEKKTEVIRLTEAEGNEANLIQIDTGDPLIKKAIKMEIPETKPVNAIKTELELLQQAIIMDLDTPVSVLDGYEAMKVSYMIMDKMNKNALI